MAKQLYYFEQSLRVEYNTADGIASVANKNGFSIHEAAIVFPIDAVLGILRNSSSEYLLFVTESDFCGVFDHTKVYRIKKTAAVRVQGCPCDEDAFSVCSFIDSNGFYYCFNSLNEKRQQGTDQKQEFLWNEKLKSLFELYKTEKAGVNTAKEPAADTREVPTGARPANLTNGSSRGREARDGRGEPADNRSFLFEGAFGTHKRGYKIKLNDIIKNSTVVDSSVRLHDNLSISDSSLFHPTSSASEGAFSPGYGPIRITHSSADTRPDFLLVDMVCGYFETRSHANYGRVYILNILSRISTSRIGPRLLSRGVNRSGAASFFVETRFTVSDLSDTTEFTILRGSVPLHWSQKDPLRPHKLSMDEDPGASEYAFDRHYVHLQEKYGNIVLVDLLGSKKGERTLSEQYRGYCLNKNRPYIHFDINGHPGSYSSQVAAFYHRLESVIKRLIDKETTHSPITDLPTGVSSASGESSPSDDSEDTPVGIGMGIPEDADSADSDDSLPRDSAWDPRQDGPVSSQDDSQLPDAPNSELSLKIREFITANKIVFRVNCLDCLDRTNLVQFLIFSYLHPFRFNPIKSMWKHNGNSLSNFYTGSDALRADLSSKGKISVFGRVNDIFISANRMINNKFTDKEKQRIINLLLGKCPSV